MDIFNCVIPRYFTSKYLYAWYNLVMGQNILIKLNLLKLKKLSKCDLSTKDIYNTLTTFFTPITKTRTATLNTSDAMCH